MSYSYLKYCCFCMNFDMCNKNGALIQAVVFIYLSSKQRITVFWNGIFHSLSVGYFAAVSFHKLFARKIVGIIKWLKGWYMLCTVNNYGNKNYSTNNKRLIVEVVFKIVLGTFVILTIGSHIRQKFWYY